MGRCMRRSAVYGLEVKTPMNNLSITVSVIWEDFPFSDILGTVRNVSVSFGF